ncbi:hypothetical protein BP00DRAFT_448310 [Aspergillus indologenus CBS 114.80]|uniref:Uncharacterized protein n=1 Tax=Aspergillus indologenus CBS 114.80 TaxID=1450541 RepID=A0A2V5ILV8_9EURO|nr:hypothetical protein BP00DRAFT_448310 [Aspergillus indologenus CBS 114.80]
MDVKVWVTNEFNLTSTEFSAAASAPPVGVPRVGREVPARPPALIAKLANAQGSRKQEQVQDASNAGLSGTMLLINLCTWFLLSMESVANFRA